MNAHDDLKRRHEVNLVSGYFLPFLARIGVELQNPRAGRSGEPDLLCDAIDGTLVGVEVADAYMSAEGATALWGMVRAIQRSGGVAPVVTSTSSAAPTAPISRLVVNPDEQLAAALQTTLDEHCLRRFAIPSYLLFNASHAPLTSAEDAPFVLARLRVPAHGYRGIYLCLARNWSSERMFFEITSKA